MANLLSGLLNMNEPNPPQAASNEGGLLGVQQVSSKQDQPNVMEDTYQKYLKNSFSDTSPIALAYTQQARDLAADMFNRYNAGDPMAVKFFDFYKQQYPNEDPRWQMLYDFRTLLTEFDREGLTGMKLPSGEDAAKVVGGIGRFDMFGRPRPPFESVFTGQPSGMRLPPSPMRQYMNRE